MVNICIDQGNTSIKTGTFQEGVLVEQKVHKDEKSLLGYLKPVGPDHIIYCSVNKKTRVFEKKLRSIAGIISVKYDMPLPFRILYESPQTLGADRIAGVAGALALFPDSNCLIVDAGTCITYDFIDREANYHGGAISPGIDMRFRAMHRFTSGLPYVSATKNSDLIGKSTTDSMRSGVLNGTLAELEGIIDRYRQLFPEISIILCGGSSKLFEKKIKATIFAVPNLVLIGLYKILKFNVHKV
jgi:type III pantothenate kinase